MNSINLPIIGLGNVIETPQFSKMKSTLEHLHSVQCGEEKEDVLVVDAKQLFLKEFITTSRNSGHSLEQVKECLKVLHTKEYLISEPIYVSAQQLANELYAATTSMANSPSELSTPEMPVDAKEPLFCKDTIYHSSICSLAVNASDAGTYQQFFKSNPMVPGHSFREISLSRGKENRYLVARQGESTFYFAFQSEPNLQQWPKHFNSFSEGTILVMSDYQLTLLPCVHLGIIAQSEEFPFRFIVELLTKQYRIVLTGTDTTRIIVPTDLSPLIFHNRVLLWGSLGLHYSSSRVGFLIHQFS